jgi:hypothetical protein
MVLVESNLTGYGFTGMCFCESHNQVFPFEYSCPEQHTLFNTDIDSPFHSFNLPLFVCALENVPDLLSIKAGLFHQGGSIYALL